MDLVERNMDYVVNSICHDLRYSAPPPMTSKSIRPTSMSSSVFANYLSFSSALLVLHALITHCGTVLVPIVDDIIDDISRGLDSKNEHFIRPLLTVSRFLPRPHFPPVAFSLSAEYFSFL